MKQMEKKLSLWKGIACLFTFAFLLLACNHVQAATAANYVMSDQESLVNGYGVRTATTGGYSVRVYKNGLYVKKGTGAWKKIAAGNANAFMGLDTTTDGKTIYYTLTTNANNLYIYSISVNGSNKKQVAKFSNTHANQIYRYGNDLYFSNRDTYRYSLTRKTKTKIASLSRMQSALYGYVCLVPVEGGPIKPIPMRVYHAPTGKTRTVAYNAASYGYGFKNGRIYYVECPQYNIAMKNYTMQVKSCKFNGTDKKSHSSKFQGWCVLEVTDKYVDYAKANGAEYRYTYSTKKHQPIRR